eukprot:GHVQ01041239.1.p1 GENE.GHVQ01041239.1~~GHVQ01041239.1.p1  ORF type:complete len:824 (+),score=101.62 GHVQ01041239.1:107-2578(+)
MSLSVCSPSGGGVTPQLFQHPGNNAFLAGQSGELNCINYIKGQVFCSTPQLADEEWKQDKYRNWAKEYLGISRQSKGFLGIATDPTIVGSVDEAWTEERVSDITRVHSETEALNMLVMEKRLGIGKARCFVEVAEESKDKGPLIKLSKTSGPRKKRSKMPGLGVPRISSGSNLVYKQSRRGLDKGVCKFVVDSVTSNIELKCDPLDDAAAEDKWDLEKHECDDKDCNGVCLASRDVPKEVVCVCPPGAPENPTTRTCQAKTCENVGTMEFQNGTFLPTCVPDYFGPRVVCGKYLEPINVGTDLNPVWSCELQQGWHLPPRGEGSYLAPNYYGKEGLTKGTVCTLVVNELRVKEDGKVSMDLAKDLSGHEEDKWLMASSKPCISPFDCNPGLVFADQSSTCSHYEQAGLHVYSQVDSSYVKLKGKTHDGLDFVCVEIPFDRRTCKGNELEDALSNYIMAGGIHCTMSQDRYIEQKVSPAFRKVFLLGGEFFPLGFSGSSLFYLRYAEPPDELEPWYRCMSNTCPNVLTPDPADGDLSTTDSANPDTSFVSCDKDACKANTDVCDHNCIFHGAHRYNCKCKKGSTLVKGHLCRLDLPETTPDDTTQQETSAAETSEALTTDAPQPADPGSLKDAAGYPPAALMRKVGAAIGAAAVWVVSLIGCAAATVHLSRKRRGTNYQSHRESSIGLRRVEEAVSSDQDRVGEGKDNSVQEWMLMKPKPAQKDNSVEEWMLMKPKPAQKDNSVEEWMPMKPKPAQKDNSVEDQVLSRPGTVQQKDICVEDGEPLTYCVLSQHVNDSEPLDANAPLAKSEKNSENSETSETSET